MSGDLSVEASSNPARLVRGPGDAVGGRYPARPAVTGRRTPFTGPGPLLFARYAYPPNVLGLCGADQPRTLLEYGQERASDPGLAELARTFEGAWPYLTLIAECNGLADPLDSRVVGAYWVGNELLWRVPPVSLASHVADRFHGTIGRAEKWVFDVIAAGAVPHHCFHVFAVYPWIGLLRTGIVDEPLRILDRCRTAPAVVVERNGALVTVRTRPLRWHDGRLSLAESTLRTVRWQEAGLAFIDPPQAGDIVVLHWDFVCDRVTPRQAWTLLRITEWLLRAVNGAGVAAAALG